MRFERFFAVSAVLLLAVGCELPADQASEDTGVGGLGGPGGTGADMPAYCQEVSRAPVTDPTVAAIGFDFPASDALAAMAGDFSGTLVTYAANGSENPPVPASLSLSVSSIDAVQLVLVDPGDDGTTDGPPMGAPDQQTACAPRYELHATAQLAAGSGLLDEQVAVDVTVFDPTQGQLTATIDLNDLQGSAWPTDIDPADWDHVDLVADATTDAGGWTGTLMWSAVIDDPESTYTYDTATGMGSGTVGVSGMSSTLGQLRLVR